MSSIVKKRNPLLNGVIHIFLFLVFLFQVFPLVTLLVSTFRTDVELKNSPLGLPKSISFDNYLVTWVKGIYGRSYINSFFIGICVIFVVLTLACLAAYGLARLQVPAKSFLTGYFTLGMSLPAFLYIVPLYYSFSKIGLINNHLSLIIIYSASYLPFSMLLIRTFLIGIPRELEEAGMIDGCSELGVLWYVTIPLSIPIITTAALVIFVWSWNEFMWANTFLTSDSLRTVSTRFYKFTSEYTRDISKIYTAGIISIFPIIFLYLCLQKSFIEGMTQGGLKG